MLKFVIWLPLLLPSLCQFLGIDTTFSLRQRSFFDRIGFRFLELRFEGFVGALGCGGGTRTFWGGQFGSFGGGAVWCVGLSCWNMLSLIGLVALLVLRRHWRRGV